jgi:hypothetical protein
MTDLYSGNGMADSATYGAPPPAAAEVIPLGTLERTTGPAIKTCVACESGDCLAHGTTTGRYLAPASTPIVKEKTPAAADTNTATEQTVSKMCEYIAQSVPDPVVQMWARRAVIYGQGRSDLMARCWGVYWLVKHAVKFARDEPRLFRMGDGDALDMLIAPAVLVRMAMPQEDCDGFTMLVCALLENLGVPWCIVTVAADRSDPDRWSHVFPMALFPDGSNVAMDASHGRFPGWMVPKADIFRWQAWDKNAAPIEVKPNRAPGLHGYVPRGRTMRMRRGMGQDDNSTPITFFGGDPGISMPPVTETPIDLPAQPGPAPIDYLPGGGVISPTSAAPSSGSSFNLSSFFNNLVSQAAGVAKIAELPAGSYISTNPLTGAQTIATGGGVASSLTSTSLLPILLIAGVGLVLVLALGKSGK